MKNSVIELSGACPMLRGLKWASKDELRIGRQDNMDIVLQDRMINTEQALVSHSTKGWVIQDLARSERSPTMLNGLRVNGKQTRLNLGDTLQFGRLSLRVSHLISVGNPMGEDSDEQNFTPVDAQIRTSGPLVKVEATSHRSWDQAIDALVSDKEYSAGHQNRHLMTLLRTGYHLGHVASLDELIRSILAETVPALDAQRGAIVLADSRGELHLRDVYAPKLPSKRQLSFSRTLALRCFKQGESLLCQDAQSEIALEEAQSVRLGAMSSILCVVLRSPRKKLGVFHLDRSPLQEPFTYQDFLLADAIAASVSIGVESAMMVDQQRQQFIQSVTSLARTVELRDQYTGDHTNRVTEYSVLLATQLKLAPTDLYHLQIGTPLHDIGKIGVDDAILRKPGRLTKEEFDLMKQHTVKGAVILQTMENLNPMIPIVRHHHERWDGSGYPDGLRQDAIPVIARVVAVADAFDAMTSDRPYRKALTASEAYEELLRGAGQHFDPVCMAAFLSLRPQLEKIMRR